MTLIEYESMKTCVMFCLYTRMVNILEFHLHNCRFSFALSLKYSIILVFREVKKKERKKEFKKKKQMMSHYLLTTSCSPSARKKQFQRDDTMRSSLKQVREALLWDIYALHARFGFVCFFGYYHLCLAWNVEEKELC